MIRLCFTHPFPERKLFPLGAQARQRPSPLSLAPLASSPKGGATGVSVRPTRDEQSLILSETVVPCYRDSRQLDKVFLSRSCCPL